jgi:alginate O-acetyltransferase complex protein AlgI
MAFNSIQYFGFFLVVLAASWMLAARPNLRLGFLLLASYYFYAANNGWILLLLLATTGIDYLSALRMARTERRGSRRYWLILSLVANLGMLGFFKYADFLLASAEDATRTAGWDLLLPRLGVALPVGISFYTFQSISYVVDVYIRRLPPERSFLRFAFYIAFFPHLVAGPIVRARYFLHQLDEKVKLNAVEMDAAFYQIAAGLMKKIVVADSLAPFAQRAFADPNQIGAVTAWIGLYAFAMQIYFDFAGYTDVAIGCARLLGYRIPPNFRRPYATTSFTEFWRRWHLSLSFWLRDYLFIPLGGSRMKSRWGVARNLMITMLLGGLWHGAAWTFVLWGGLHGLLLVFERIFGLARFARDFRGRPVARILRSFVMFNLIVLTWLPFRAQNFATLKGYVAALLRPEHGATLTLGMAAVVAVALGGFALDLVNEQWPLRRIALARHVVLRGLGYGVVALVVLVFSARGTVPFIYFAF